MLRGLGDRHQLRPDLGPLACGRGALVARLSSKSLYTTHSTSLARTSPSCLPVCVVDLPSVPIGNLMSFHVWYSRAQFRLHSHPRTYPNTQTRPVLSRWRILVITVTCLRPQSQAWKVQVTRAAHREARLHRILLHPRRHHPPTTALS